MNFLTTEMLIYHDAQKGKVSMVIAKKYINKLMRIISDCSDEYNKTMEEYFNERGLYEGTSQDTDTQ